MKGEQAKAWYKSPGKNLLFFEGELKIMEDINPSLEYFVMQSFEPDLPLFFLEKCNTPFKFSPIQIHNGFSEGQDIPKVDYLSYINKIQAEIESGSLEKVVAARSKTLKISEKLNLEELTKSAIQEHPNAYITAWQTDSFAYFGVSPELLLEGEFASGSYKTVALAGTASLSDKSQQLGEKEKSEQHYIVRHFEDIFSKNKWAYNVLPQQKIKAGNLNHLFNEIQFIAPSEDWSNIAHQIHPSPAVNGYPTLKAMEFIKQNESSKRGFYSGFSGIVNQNQILLSVNLRCVIIQNGQARLWAGAGITSDSNPEKEWNETELKMQTMMELINGN